MFHGKHEEKAHRKHKAKQNRADGQRCAQPFPFIRDERDQCRGHEGREENDPDGADRPVTIPHPPIDAIIEKPVVHSRMVVSSSTLMDCLRRYSATIIARPTATSAAAMAMMKNTRICPSIILLNLENAIRARLAALRFISNAM